jgi:hypothetical protein
MHVSLLPFRASELLGPLSRGAPSHFTPPASRRGTARFTPGAGLKLTPLIRSGRESGQRKKAGRRAVVLKFQRKSQCSAAGRCFALSLTAGAPPQVRARSRYFALDFFALEPGLVSWVHTDLAASPTRPVWRFHVPRIWIRSINGRKFSVKRKTQNVVDVFVLRLFVVVPFPLNCFLFNAFRFLASHATLLASNPT